jgi:hypothetical protein
LGSVRALAIPAVDAAIVMSRSASAMTPESRGVLAG